KSTKRRRFFALPMRRQELESPSVLPRIEELSPCCPGGVQPMPLLPATTAPPEELPISEPSSPSPAEPSRRPDRMPRGSETPRRDATAVESGPGIIEDQLPLIETGVPPLRAALGPIVPVGHWQPDTAPTGETIYLSTDPLALRVAPRP